MANVQIRFAIKKLFPSYTKLLIINMLGEAMDNALKKQLWKKFIKMDLWL
jgi:hypothetical protein